MGCAAECDRLGCTQPLVTMAKADDAALVSENVHPVATVSADEAIHRDALHPGLQVDRVNHSVTYGDRGKQTNRAEKYSSCLRRMVVGQHHHVSPQHLHQFANQSAWLEDNRRVDNGALAYGLVECAMASLVSQTWKGYWQRAA